MRKPQVPLPSSQAIAAALKKAGGNSEAAAKALGISGSRVRGWRIRNGGKKAEKPVPPQPSWERDLEVRRLAEKIRSTEDKYAGALRRIEQLESENAVFATLKAAGTKPMQFKPPKAFEATGNAAAVVTLCDWHCAEVVDPRMLEYRNEHNVAIFRRRCQRLVEKVDLLYKFARGFANVTEFHVWALGDLMSNYLHEELMETNELGPTEEMLEVKAQLEGIVYRCHELAEVPHGQFYVSTCHGNHARLTRRRRYKVQHKTNMEWQLCQDLANRAGDDNRGIVWNVSRGNSNRVRVLDRWSVRIHHGDDVRYEGGIGGLTIPLLKAVKAWNENARADYTYVGHWHQFLRLWRTVVCGCMVGYNEFAQAYKCEAQPPTQVFSVFDSEKGLVLCEPLFVE